MFGDYVPDVPAYISNSTGRTLFIFQLSICQLDYKWDTFPLSLCLPLAVVHRLSSESRTIWFFRHIVFTS